MDWIPNMINIYQYEIMTSRKRMHQQTIKTPVTQSLGVPQNRVAGAGAECLDMGSHLGDLMIGWLE